MTYVHVPKPTESATAATPQNGGAAPKEAPKPPPLPAAALKSAPKEQAEAVRLPISQILFDHAWNARSKADTERVISTELAGYDPELESTGMGGGGDKTEPGLVEMITEQGQLDPIDVRPASKKDAKLPYEAASGFRRQTALLLIAEAGVKAGNFHPIKADPGWDARNPTIWAIVRPMTDLQARIRNVNEGTSHNALSTPDLAFGVEALRLASKAEGKEMSGVDIAREIGKSKTLVSQLLSVMRLPAKITKHWRHGGEGTFDGKKVVSTAPLGLSLMYELTNVDGADIQEREYAKLLSNAVPRSKKGVSPEQKKFAVALKRGQTIGETIGWLAYCVKNIEKPTPTEWALIAEELIGFTRPNGKPVTESQMRQMVDGLKEAFKNEQNRLANPEGIDEEDEEEAEKTRGKRDGGR